MPSLDVSYRRFRRSYDAPTSSPTPQAEASTPAAARPPTRRIDFLAHFLAALRLQEKPRLSTYAILCFVARYPTGTWQVEIDHALTGIMGPQCESLAKQGFLTLENRKRTGARQARWVTLTPDGAAIVALLLNPTQGKGLVP
jgi:hypothetical protein